MTRKELLAETLAKIGNKPHARDDARQILMHVTNASHADLIAHDDKGVSRLMRSKALSMASERAQDKPMAYILGKRDFYGHRFAVNKHTLIPRPETEVMLSYALNLADTNTYFIDLGTGSGVLAISIALGTINHVCATDISRKALRVARRNARDLNAQLHFHHGHLLEPICANALKDHINIIITANLPYLSEKMLSMSPTEVRGYEPIQALVSDDYDGLNLYRELLFQIRERQRHPDGTIIVLIEIDPRQEHLIEPMAHEIDPTISVQIKNDLAGKPRVVILKY